MNEVMAWVLGYSSVGRLFVGAAVMVLLWVALGLTQPMLLLVAVLLALALFPASSLLIGEKGLGFDIYGKGSGYLFFSVYEISIMMLAMCLTLTAFLQRGDGAGGLRARRAVQPLPRNPYAISYWLLFALLAGYGLASELDADGSWLRGFSRSGIVYAVIQGLLLSCMVAVVRDQATLRQVVTVFALAVGARMLWGVVRFVVLGGDPANYYETEGNKFRITFWDINDSILALMLAAGLVWLAAARKGLSAPRRSALLLAALTCLAIVALSSRRTAQTGGALALLLLWPLLPKGRRWWMGLLLALMLPLAAYQFNKRFAEDGGSFIQKLMVDEQKGKFFVDPRYKRSYEWEAAKVDILKNPWFGVGPSGRFNPPSHRGLEYHRGNYGFIHSGFGHVLLKTGLVGLTLFLSIFVVYAVIVTKQWQRASHHHRAYLAASLAGVVANLPNLISGTPLIELRTMLVLGVALAIPAMVARAAQAEMISATAASKTGRPALTHRQLRSLRATWGRS